MRSHIHTVIKETLESIGAGDVSYTVEYPHVREHGEYTTNAALVAAKAVGNGPHAVAEALKDALSGIEGVSRVVVAGPGFLNIYMERSFFTDAVSDACSAGERWGYSDDEAGREVLVEYTSPNLFKPLHVGNLVGNIIGESLARLAEMRGATVRRIMYPCDIGLTVAKGVWGLGRTGGSPENIADLGEAYRAGNAAYEDGTGKRDIEEVNKALYRRSDSDLTRIGNISKQTSLAHIADICTDLGTVFDSVIPESDAAPVGTAVVRQHLNGVFEEDDGAVIYRGERSGLHTRVFINSAGLPTYEAKDIGNFSIKQEQYPDWDVSLVVTGNEQREYFRVIIAAIRDVFGIPEEKEMKHIATGFLTLPTGKMSSRKGNILTAESILADLQREAMKHAEEMRVDDSETVSRQIAVGALKYWILRQRVGSDIVFDMRQAFSFEGDSGPYIQYTHARIQSVLRKAAGEGIEPSVKVVPDTVYEPERLLHQFSSALAASYVNYTPHHLINYMVRIAGAFNRWYADERIVDTRDVYGGYRVAVAKSVGQTLQNGLYAAGIPSPEQM